MDKEKATRTLAKILAENEKINIIDSALSFLHINKAICSVELDHQPTLFSGDSQQTYTDCFINILKKETELMKKIGANYLFIAPAGICQAGNHAIAFEKGTPFGVIGEKEAEFLRKKFYKDVPKEIKEAFDVLNIENYIEGYESYIKGTPAGTIEEDLKKGKKYVKGKRVVCVKEYENGVFPGEEGVIKQINKVNIGVLWDNCLGKRHDQFGQSGHCWWVPPSHIVYEKSPHLQDFAKLMFSVPENYEKTKANEQLLEQSSNETIRDIFQNLYKNSPDWFKEYFTMLTQEQKVAAAEGTKTANQQVELNIWLYRQGFTEGNYIPFLDYYFNHQEEFKKHFKQCNENSQKEIIDIIYSLPQESVNKEINNWISSFYPRLATEVGRDRVYGK